LGDRVISAKRKNEKYLPQTSQINTDMKINGSVRHAWEMQAPGATSRAMKVVFSFIISLVRLF